MKQKAFTLIELLVVIAIIGLLASIILIALSNARAKARDNRRIADIKQIQTALELYLNENNQYPSSTNNGCGGWDESTKPGFLSALVTQGILPKSPADPLNTGSCGGYEYRYYRYNAGSYGCDVTQGAYYVLGVGALEKSPPPAPNPGFSCSGRNWGSEFQWVTGNYEQ